MNRPFPRLEVLGLTTALALVGACAPNNSVKPGAPVLTEISIIENAGATITVVTPTTGDCPTGTNEGGSCDPTAFPACEASNVLCHCVPPAMTTSSAPSVTSDAAPPEAGTSDAGASDAGATKDSGADGAAASTLTGTWSCSFAPTAVVLYTFDRLLDTKPFITDAGGQSNAALAPVFVPAPATPVSLTGDYAPNGSPDLLIFKAYSLRAAGPSLLFAGAPTLPTGTAVTITLDKTNVRAKDGRTPFTGMNLLLDGAISFVTQSFSATVVTPPPPEPVGDAAASTDVVPDMTAATVTFNNTVCPQLADGTFDKTAISKHITVTSVPAIPAAVTFDLACVDGSNVSVTPHPTWPASSMITISVDAAAADILGDTLGAAGAMAATKSFNTEAM